MTKHEHLQRIRAKCVENLAIAEKRTPGKWLYGWNMIGDGIGTIICIAPMRSETLTASEWVEDKRFIAACAGAAEAGWRSTIAAIDFLLRDCPRISGLSMSRNEKSMCDDILTAWPEELL